MEVKEGMEVFGVFRGQTGHFSARGIVTEVQEQHFTAVYKVLPQSRIHMKADIGKEVFLRREDADRSAEEREDAIWQQAREDFAEQNQSSLLGNI